MKVLIIEDEPRAASLLSQMLLKIDGSIEIQAVLESVKDSVAFLKQQNELDLIFSDIQLEDGLSFEVFKKVKVNCPIIFTTAYDQYAIQAFQTNGIGYLLKPLEEENLKENLAKYKRLNPGVSVEKLLALADLTAQKKKFKSRFILKIGDRIKTLNVEDIVAFYSLEKVTYVFTHEQQKYIMDHSLDQLESMLDPERFFRINRKYLLALEACHDIISWSSSRLKVKVKGLEDHETVVARERYRKFRDWLEG